METANARPRPAPRSASTWFGASAPPADLQIGSYTGAGVGLSTGGDAVTCLRRRRHAASRKVTFGISPTGRSARSTTRPRSTTRRSRSSALSASTARSSAHSDAAEIGSPGRIAAPAMLIISEVAPWSSGNSPVGADWFEVTNIGASAANIAGWKIDDSSESPAGAALLNGITSIAPGESVIFLETANLAAASAGVRQTLVRRQPASGSADRQLHRFGTGPCRPAATPSTSTTSSTCCSPRCSSAPSSSDSRRLPPSTTPRGSTSPASRMFSVAGVNGAFVAALAAEVGSPGTILADTMAPTITFSGNAGSYTADQFVLIQCAG